MGEQVRELVLQEQEDATDPQIVSANNEETLISQPIISVSDDD